MPTWDSHSKAPARSYMVRAKNLGKWTLNDVKGLFETFKPKKITKDGDDWLVTFATQTDMDEARIVDGEILPSKSGSKQIRIFEERC